MIKMNADADFPIKIPIGKRFLVVLSQDKHTYEGFVTGAHCFDVPEI